MKIHINYSMSFMPILTDTFCIQVKEKEREKEKQNKIKKKRK